MKGWVICFTCILGVTHGFLGVGKEHKYNFEVRLGVGTMDHAPAASADIVKFQGRIQHTSKDTLKVELVDLKYAPYVGPWDRSMSPESLNFLPFSLRFQFEMKIKNGLFKSLSMPGGLSMQHKNVIKGIASHFQLNLENMKANKQNFKSTEETVQGLCDVSYTVTSNTIYKTTVLNKDCKNLVKKRFDDFYGHDCNKEDKDKTDSFTSTSNIYYEFDGEGDNRRITKMQSIGALIVQSFNTEGVSHLSTVNMTAVLTSEGPDPGDISGGSETTDTLQYQFSDHDYKWNKDRNLKDAEPETSSGFFHQDQNDAKEAILNLLDKRKDILHNHEMNAEGVKNAHNFGIGKLDYPMSMLNYDSLKSLHDRLAADSSKEGKMKLNIFTELLGDAGSTASAVFILDLLKAKKFDNQRDAGMTLSSIPYHIRRPNKQLVQQFKELLETDQEDAVKMAIPLTYAHLVRVTCERAGATLQDPELIACVMDIGRNAVEYFVDKFKNTNDRKLKNLYLSALTNLRWGGVSMLLKPLIYGQTGDHSEQRSNAIWAVLHELAAQGESFEYLFPVFAEEKNNHEVRMSAVRAIMMLRPSPNQIAKIINVLSREKDLEVINGVFSLLETMAKSISSCDRKIKNTAGFFLKYLKQYSKYNVDYGLGVTKMYTRQFNKRKYGYGGSYLYYVDGSHHSTTPLSVGMGISSSINSNYLINTFHVHLRIEGLAKSLIKKFKTTDPTIWKTANLKTIFSQMGIKERTDQPLRASVTILLKGVVVIQRSYDESEGEEGGKLKNFMDNIQGLGKDYLINHQRILKVGSILIEQPNVLGVPMLYGCNLMVLMCLKAKLKRGQNRGTFFANAEYDLHLFGQGQTWVADIYIDTKTYRSVLQDRVYHLHLPRKLTIGVNPLTKKLMMKISRAKYDKPSMFMMHSKTSVDRGSGKSFKPGVGLEDLKQSCPSCPPSYTVSNGDPRDREIINRETSKYGYRVEAKYFDCEMDIEKTNTVARGIAAFMPYNKNPRTPWTMLSMGIRQIIAFFVYFPKAEKCGMLAKFSQSRENPVREMEIEISGSTEIKSERLFLRGALTKVKVGVKAVGDQTRAYRLSFSRQTSPGELKVSTRIKFDRAKNTALGIPPYTICAIYKANYPGFPKEMFDVDFNTEMKMQGELKVQYGETTSCDAGEGEVEVNFEYSTTQEAREALKKKWYYKDCMEKKNSPAWQGRNALPSFSKGRSCYLTAYDACNARKYKYDVKFNKLTDRAKSIIETIRSLVRTYLLPYYGDDDASNGELGPFLKMEVTMKEDDKIADVVIETSQGTKKINDYPLRLPWAKRLRNLRFTKTYERFFDYGIVKSCQLTSQYVETLDNVTYPIKTPSCWTLMSGHCSPTPSYAVFVKKNSGKPLAMKAYIGGHTVEIDPNSKSVKVNGADVAVSDDNEAGTEVLKISKWGTTFNIYSFLRIWIIFDGNFVTVVPAPSVKGQHCGLCGNYNRNQWDEAIGKDGVTNVGISAITEEWKWQC